MKRQRGRKSWWQVGLLVGVLACSRTISTAKPVERVASKPSTERVVGDSISSVATADRSNGRLPGGAVLGIALVMDGAQCYGEIRQGGKSKRVVGWVATSVQAASAEKSALKKSICHMEDAEGRKMKGTIWLAGAWGPGNKVFPAGQYEWSEAEVPAKSGRASFRLEGLGEMTTEGGYLTVSPNIHQEVWLDMILRRAGH